MSKVKSSLGEIVDFEMMKIMAEFGPTQTASSTPSASTVVNPNVLVRDNIAPQAKIMTNPEFTTTTVSVPREVVVETPQKITITTPESVKETSVKLSKKGAKE